MRQKNWLIIIGLMAVLALVVVGCGQQPQETEAPPAGEEEQTTTPPTEEQTPTEGTATQGELVSSEDKPEGCVSCHTKEGDTDHTLAAEIAAMVEAGNHTQTDAQTPQDCLQCHSNNFAQVLHTAHLTGDENHFVTNYGGACVQCHAVGDSGEVVVKGLTDEGVTKVALETTTEDQAAEGCASCHKKEGDTDHTLAAEIAAMVEEGTHTQTDAQTPPDCLQCHSQNFSVVLHKAHLTGEENHFVSNYGASCNNCHTLGSDGSISVKGL